MFIELCPIYVMLIVTLINPHHISLVHPTTANHHHLFSLTCLLLTSSGNTLIYNIAFCATLYMYLCIIMHMYNMDEIQWNLFIKDTLGPANLSTVERLWLSTLQRWKCINTIGKFIFGASESVLCREVISMVSFNRGSTVYSIQYTVQWWGCYVTHIVHVTQNGWTG